MKTESGQVATAIEIYKTDNNGKTPISTYGQQQKISTNISTGKLYEEKTDEYVEVMEKLVEDGYISAVPKSPDGSSYIYGESTDGTEAVFATKLRSRSAMSSNTNNSCSVVVTENLTPSTKTPDIIPMLPPPCQVPLASDPLKQQSCLEYTGLLMNCSTDFDEGYIYCYYSIPPQTPVSEDTQAPLCNGTQEDDYCRCI